MSKAIVVLVMVGTMSVAATARTAPSTPSANQAQAAKPKMVKKQICEDTKDNPYSSIRRGVCRTIQAPAQAAGSSDRQAFAPSSSPNSANR